MRIAIVNWAGIADGASTGGGVNGYCRQLALGLAARGHRVAWLSSGMTYTPSASGGLGECRVRRRDDYAGVQVYEVVNAPVVAPGIFQFPDPAGEVRSPVLEAEIARLMAILSPDIVHFHNIEGFSAGSLAAARARGADGRMPRVLYSLHNYHTVCPQVYLMKRGRTPCVDFEGGRACVDCVTGWETRGVEMEQRRRAGLPEVAPPSVQIPARESLWRRLGPGIMRRLRPPVPLPVIEPPMPGRGVWGEHDVQPDAPAATSEMPGTNAAGIERSEHTTPLSNATGPEPAGDGELNEYGRRRRAMVGALSGCDGVLAVSDFVRRKFIAMGVSERVIEALPIGSKMAEIAAAMPHYRISPPPLNSGRPIRMVFMGYNNYFKGLPMLLDTLERLPPDCLARYHVHIWAKDIERDLDRIHGLVPRLGGVSVAGSYRYEDVPAMLCGKDVGIVPSVWWDNGPQTVMEFMACGLPVIGARAGGIPELIREGVDGLVFTANDRAALAGVLRELAAGPERLEELRANVRPPKRMEDHVGEIEAVYQRGAERGDRAGGGA